MMKVLGIETSCDDTSLAILEGESSSRGPGRLLAHLSFNQDEVLKDWGGVIPEIAARNHLDKLTPALKEALARAKVSLSDIDLIGVTTHPGLLGPLLTGLNCAKTLALFHQLPILPVNHLYAHLEAIHLCQQINYPYLGILVSGGHGLFIAVNAPGSFEVLGSTIDDAPGEAFDKGGKLLGLGYPAGKLIDERAKLGDKSRFSFPIGLKNSKDSTMSFSGTKTALRNLLDKNPELRERPKDINDLCASYQEAIVEAVCLKSKEAYVQAKKKWNHENFKIVLAGGVACNSRLRERLREIYPNLALVAPEFCTDNGAMIANFAYLYRESAIPFPECLKIDARGQFISKTEYMAKRSPLS